MCSNNEIDDLSSTLKITTIAFLYVPPFYENEFSSAVDRLRFNNEKIDLKIFTLDKRVFHRDLNRLLNMCRSIISEEKDIEILFADSLIDHLIIAKLVEEFPRIRSGGANFISTLRFIDRSLLNDIFNVEQCLPTRIFSSNENLDEFLRSENRDVFVKSNFSTDFQLSTFRFSSSSKQFDESIRQCRQIVEEHFDTCLRSLFNIYLSSKQFDSMIKAKFLVQPFFDLVQFPHWRLIIANACIYEKEIIVWPLVDGYSGWPFLSERPLAILPILICPSQHLSFEQKNLLYIRFRQDLDRLIIELNLRFGWIECSYFVSCSNEIRLISVKPKCSTYLIEAFRVVCQYGHPIEALVQMSLRQRPSAPIVNGKTVYIHRLWTKNDENLHFDDLIDFIEIQRLDRLRNSCSDRYVRLRFQPNDRIESKNFTEVGFLQVSGEYFEISLANLIECRSMILKHPKSFPFAHRSMLDYSPDDFDSVTCLPSMNLVDQWKQIHQNKIVG